MEQTMTYLVEINTPLRNAEKALFDLRMALYDIASVKSAVYDFEASGEAIKMRDRLHKIEAFISQLDKANVDALESELKEAGIY
jgi:hypothetical protein